MILIHRITDKMAGGLQIKWPVLIIKESKPVRRYNMSLEKIIVNIDPDLEELIPGFLENRIKDIEILKNAAGQGDLAALKSVGHSLKGVGGGYGFAKITELGAGIEASAKINDMERINQLISDLTDYLQRIEVKYQ